MSLTPWDRAKSGTEHGEQSALFMWCNMAAMFGPDIANFPAAYTMAGWAKSGYATGMESGNISPPLPQLSRLYAIKNQGHGDRVRGAQSKAEGVKAGVPDLFLPIPRTTSELDRETFGPLVTPFMGGGYGFGGVCGLYIELKRKGTVKAGKRKAEVIDKAAGKTSEVQEEWIPFLRSQGYAVAVCVGWEEAREMLLRYLGVKPA